MSFFKFPRTPHLFVLPGLNIRDDKQLSDVEANEFYLHEVVVEEKIDGANIGISLDEEGNFRIQNRGAYIDSSSHPQFAKLTEWMYLRMLSLKDVLIGPRIIFGEWCYAKHSIYYETLPDYFLGFDVYDLTHRYFLPTHERNYLFKQCNIHPVPLIGEKRFKKAELITILNTTKSAFSTASIEGLYVRLENKTRLIKRAKIVKEDFVQEIDGHWSKGKLIKNLVVSL
ncbi:RNA ligase family protein [Chitinophaga sp. NPDC101104]|uniref:RNA ligase family protein n=1 Tax=Chitinophaga sp. NPDC101104 TaxID=3390561 RepID=UPI003D08C246